MLSFVVIPSEDVPRGQKGNLNVRIMVIPSDKIIRFYLEGPINTPPSVPPKVQSPGGRVPVERGITKEGVAYASLSSLGAQESCV